MAHPSPEQLIRALLAQGYTLTTIIQGVRAIRLMDHSPGSTYEKKLAFIQALDRGEPVPAQRMAVSS